MKKIFQAGVFASFALSMVLTPFVLIAEEDNSSVFYEDGHRADTRLNADATIEVMVNDPVKSDGGDTNLREIYKKRLEERRRTNEERATDANRPMEMQNSDARGSVSADSDVMMQNGDRMNVRIESRATLGTKTDKNLILQEREDHERRKRLHDEEMEQKRREIISNRESRLGEERKERVESHIEKILERFQAAIGRLTELAVRIESRVDKLSELGADTSAVETALIDARIKIDEAQASVETAGLISIEILEGETPGEALVRVRGHLTEAKEAIKSAHQALVESIRILKNINIESESGIESETNASVDSDQ
ncbi:MAG: hypothetical protein COV70_03975 [Parcubacteria group bacterium CG11_big_fil_rev_8_21_14_0_20_39_22]|nr:MAG: hypothetical protein COV70_03975 [Parcubacteria group bacterium CG11_big_fil_rev_8_21_14_0_20_39_22]